MSQDIVLKPLNSVNKTEVMKLMEATGLWGMTSPGHPCHVDQEGAPGGTRTPALLTRPGADVRCRLSLGPQGPAASAPSSPCCQTPGRGAGRGPALPPLWSPGLRRCSLGILLLPTSQMRSA